MPNVSPDDPSAVWDALLSATRSQAALGWMDLYRLTTLQQEGPGTGMTARIAPIRNGDFARRSASPARLARLGELLGQIVQQPVAVRLIDTPTTPSAGQAPDQSQPSDTLDRDSAYRMTAVREVLDVFPDAVVVSVRKNTTDPDVP